MKKAAVVIAVLGILVGSAYGCYRHYYPFGLSHRCDKGLWFALREYADAHGGRFPSGEATPEASLSLLGPGSANLLCRRDVPLKVVQGMLDRGELLTPETCGWNYVEGLRLDSDSRLALFWDKEGLDEMGGRPDQGGHFVSLVGWPYNYIPASEWGSFLRDQQQLLTEEKAKAQNNEPPQSPAARDHLR